MILELDYPALSLFFMAIFSFVAGFIDSVAGGGGLIQLPALLITVPNAEIPVLFGTNKIAGLSGTSMAAWQYAKKIRFQYGFLFVMSAFTAIASFWGAQTLHLIDKSLLKPLILVVLIIIAIYTFVKKDLGQKQTKNLSNKEKYFWGIILGIVIGFYDGFFGPGTGSFLMIGFVVILGYEFILASAYAKFINSVANLAALSVFIWHGNFILSFAIVMSVSNVLGNYFGSKTAIRRGNQFIRLFFLLVISILILRYAYDVLQG
ncbi:MAG TPA: sulfite exporter TauE/SafE family protein [Salinivirgaceae bacterium]|nr:sulfite exporter TauE/SafE family protein [Salinivirgaceae bacterium]